MNREQRRASEKEGRRRQGLPWDSFNDVTALAYAKHVMLSGDPSFRPDRVYQNNKYIVQVFYRRERKGRFYTKVMVRRSDAEPIYSWSDLYRIKNEIFGEEIEAVQFMPPKSELIDEANLYWFWIEESKP